MNYFAPVTGKCSLFYAILCVSLFSSSCLYLRDKSLVSACAIVSQNEIIVSPCLFINTVLMIAVSILNTSEGENNRDVLQNLSTQYQLVLSYPLQQREGNGRSQSRLIHIGGRGVH